MRVLWFSINASCYTSKISTMHESRGWVSSLEKILSARQDIHLGIAFEYGSDKFKDIIGNIEYYPISVSLKKMSKFRKTFSLSEEEKRIIPECMRIIEDFKPDIIQCFGSEWCYGLVAAHTTIPVVIHMQGSMPTYYNVLYPPRYSKYSKALFNLERFHIKAAVRSFFSDKINAQRAEREIRILKLNKYFLGRTDWDKSITKLFAPNSSYFVCNEALRDSFQKGDVVWAPKNNKLITLCTTGSGSLWKGLDVILKTAYILKNYTDLKFRWLLAGGESNKAYIEWMEKKSFRENNVEFVGLLNERQLAKTLLASDMYVHPAYIDNSPNALCEAMILGLPCIASYVGGIPSLIQDGISGILVPVNEPYFLAEKIVALSKDTELQRELSKNAILSAKMRHSPSKIENELIFAYKQILQISNTKNQ